MVSHLADDVISALIDEQLSPPELAEAHTHLAACPACQQRLDELRSVVGLLRGLPSEAPPRSFALGPRLVADPPNVVRLRRLYTATRVAAATFAAGFVFLSAGALYVDSRPASKAASTAEVLSAPQARDIGKPAAALAPSPVQPAAAGAPAAARPQTASNAADPADQIAAATTVRPLPTPVPTPTPVVVAPTPMPVALAPQPGDEAAPLRLAAIALGVLAVLALLAALVTRHRVQASASRP
jgi:Putative zinc-finger